MILGGNKEENLWRRTVGLLFLVLFSFIFCSSTPFLSCLKQTCTEALTRFQNVFSCWKKWSVTASDLMFLIQRKIFFYNRGKRNLKMVQPPIKKKWWQSQKKKSSENISYLSFHSCPCSDPIARAIFRNLIGDLEGGSQDGKANAEI